MTVNFNTSRSRFDEGKRFTGIYQRMGQVAVDADWNEEVRLRTVDARRRTADVADGSPDDGFRICADFVIDPILSTAGWVATELPPDDERLPVPELRLDRHDPETLPWVLKSRWHTALRRTLGGPIDLTALPRAASTAFAAAALIVELRLERPPADDEEVDIRVVIGDADGQEAAIAAAGRGLQPSGWCEIVVTAAELGGIDVTRVTSWGVVGLPPVARVWVGALRAVDALLGTDVVIRGGDGTLAGAGRMLIDGYRVFLERDLRYSSQPDFPDAVPLPDLPADGSRHHVFFLDVHELTVTGLEDPFLIDPALDGVDTAARLRVVAQVRALPLVASVADERLPSATGGGALSTNIASGVLPDRDPPEPFDPCRDRCLFTDNASTGDGYIGSDNLHVRVQVMRVGDLDVALWSRDNASTVMALTQATALDSTTLRVAPADAVRLRSGDVVVIEDRATRLRWDAPSPPVLRRLRGVQAETGLLELDEAGANLTTDPVPLPAGGPVGRVFSPDAGATVRRWDGADLLVTGVRYRLSDGITFAFEGTGWRSGDHWTFTARVHAPDGAATGVVDTLVQSPPHAPVHHYMPLARATGQPRVIEDLRRRYLPLVEVRDRLKELGDKKYGPGVFVVVVGDGARTFGDVDQSLADGLTGDEAIQAALGLLGDRGGSIFIRTGQYQLEQPVLVRGMSSLRLLGDGDSTVLDVRGAGGAFYLDRSGESGAVSIEDLTLIEDPAAEVDIGEPGVDVDRPASRVRTLFDKLIDARFSPVAMPAERPLGLDDIRIEGGVPNFLGSVGARLRVLAPGEGRVAGSVAATVVALRRLQRQHPNTTLEQLPEAQPLLGALSALPHGVVTIADSHQVAVRGCRIEARRPGVNAVGVMVTGTCGAVEISGNRIAAAAGVAALPYAPYLANGFLVAFPRAGLSLEGLTVAGNDIRAAGAAATGVHVADGLLSGTAVEGNRVSGFTVGVLIDDQAEVGRAAATDRIAVRDNRIIGATAVGIQVTGDGVDVVGNEIQNAVGPSPFQAGVQLTGHSSRVLDCWIEIPSAPALAPVALMAGVVVGEGLDDGSTPSRPVYDVEIAGNRIEGSGADSAAIGIVVGGSQPIYGVRVRDNVIRNLGDAALRTWSTSAPVGRLSVEGNRIERVALGDLAVQADNGPVLDRLQPGITATLPAGAAARPRSLLAALVDSALPAVRGPLDAALRWVERLSLRGAVVLGGVEGGVVRGNHIAEVGREGDFAALTVDGAEIRTAAIAVVAAAEVLVEDNAIEAVRAPYAHLEGPGGEGGAGRPAMLDVLAALGLGPAATRIDRGDVHLAAADLRSRVLAYASAPVDRRPRLGSALFAPLDALVGELAHMDGAPAALAETLRREATQLRSAASADEQTAAASAVRATLSQVSSVTAPDDPAQDAWDAAAQLDLAMAGDAEAIAAAATRLVQRADTLTEGMVEALKSNLVRALRKLISEPGAIRQVLVVAGLLGQVATVRDQQARKKDLPSATDLVGPRRTIVSTFADAALRQLDALGGRAAANVDRLGELRQAKEALVDQLRDVSGALAGDLAADFQDVDRTGGRVKAPVDRLRATLGKIGQLAAGELPPENLTADDAARGDAQGRAATIQMYTKSLDRQIGGLAAESDESAQKSLASLHGLMGQLGELVADQPEIRELATQATAAVRAAGEATQRQAQLGLARSLLDRVRGSLVEVLPPLILAEPVPAEAIERRMAALGALALELDTVDAATVAPSLAAYSAHLDRVLDLLHADASERQRAHDTLADAGNSLGDAPGPIRARAVHALVDLVDAAAAKAVGAGADAPDLLAAATLLHAAALAVDPGEDGGTRVARVKAFLAQRVAKLSAALVAQAQQAPDERALVALLHDGLARIARGVDLVLIDARPPAFPLAPAPADGVFAAGVERRARITGNLITEALSGVVVLGAAGHVITEPPDDGAVLEIGDNRVSGCAALGLAARPDGASTVVVWDNYVLGCAGLAVSTGDPWGQAVVVIAGQGDLVVRSNVLSDNGNTTLRALLHEIAVDWRGPVGLRGNTVRHLGGGAGGAGLLVTTEPVAAGLIAQLAQAPFLGAEPPPRPIPTGRLPIVPDLLFSLREVAPLSPLSGGSDLIALGGLRQSVATTPIVSRALTLPAMAAPAPAIAASMATRYVDRSRLFAPNPIIDFLRRPPLVFVPPRVARPVDSVHVEGNDVDAAGPALLLLSEGHTLIAASVTGNDLRSRGRAGAAYLRRTDSTLFSGNRCECLAVVNVVVLRPGKAPVSATGNVIVGAEPVSQPAVPPVVKAPSGAVQLSIGLGASALTVPIDARKLLGGLDRRKNLASDTFAELLADIGTAPAPSGAVADRALGVAAGGPLSSSLLDEPTRAAIAATLPAGITPVVGARTLYGHTAGDETDPATALKKLVDQVALHEQEPGAARVKVGAILTAAAGDPTKALQLLDQTVLGLDTTKPTIKEALDNVSLIHEVLGDVLIAGAGDEAALAPVPRPAPPPRPADHSLVVIGGTRVAVVGNATTAGVLVQNADAHVELNP